MKSVKFMSAILISASLGSIAMASPSGTLTISGIVALVNDITVTANSNATALNITGGESAKLVATVVESSNDVNGYQIKMASANGGFLVNGSASSQKTAYKLGYDGSASATLSSAGTVVKSVNSLSGLASHTSNVNVDVTAMPLAVAGTYSDTITVTIVAN